MKADLITALSGGRPKQLPFVPKIWVDLAAALTGVPLRRVIEDPLEALSVILQVGRELGLDGVRQFHFPARRLAADADGGLVEVDSAGRRLGRIDLAGGLQTMLEDAADCRLEDPAWMAFFQYRHPPGPLVTSLAAARGMCVPGKAVYGELGWGARQREAQRLVFGADSKPEAGPMILADCGSIGISFCAYFNGMGATLTGLFDDPSLAHALMAKGVAIAAEKGKYWLDQGLRVLRINDSGGNMSVLSPDHWREFVLPGLRELVGELHRYEPSCLLYCHICGNTLPIMADLAASGLDCIAPLDPLGGFTVTQARTAVEAAAQPSGRRAALMGGIDTQSFVRSSPREIVAEARACVEGAFPAGGRAAGKAQGLPAGFILGSGCALPRTARPENLRAVAEWAAGLTL